MIDPRKLRQDAANIAERLQLRGMSFDLEGYRTLEADRKRLQMEMESLQQERNRTSKSIGQAKAHGEDIQPLLDAVGDLGTRLDDAKTSFDAVQTSLDELLDSIPNVPDASVPAGSSEDDNVEVGRWGEPPEFNFEPKDHVDLAPVDLDMETASKLTGSRFSVMRGGVARLHRGLTQFMLDLHSREHGYEELYVPYMVNRDSLRGTGQLPKFADDLFHITGADYFLIPTAEVPVTNLVRDRILDEAELPMKFVAHTLAFAVKREATARTLAASSVSISSKRWSSCTSCIRRGRGMRSTNSLRTPKPSCRNSNYRIDRSYFVAVTWALRPPRRSISKSGCRARTHIARFHRAATSWISRRGACSRDSGMRRAAISSTFIR